MSDLHATIRAALDPSTGYRELDDRAREWLAALIEENEALRAQVPTDAEARTIRLIAGKRDTSGRRRVRAYCDRLESARAGKGEP